MTRRHNSFQYQCYRYVIRLAVKTGLVLEKIEPPKAQHKDASCRRFSCQAWDVAIPGAAEFDFS
jgi:hypothetical protein